VALRDLVQYNNSSYVRNVYGQADSKFSFMRVHGRKSAGKAQPASHALFRACRKGSHDVGDGVLI